MICRLKNVAISAISTYLPPNVLEMDTLSQLFGEDKVKVIRNATGVDRVHVANAGQTASDECFEAAQLLFEKEGLDRSSVNGLIFVSQTFDYIAPATSVILQDRLGLSKDTVCFDVSFGCSGYINGVYLASTLVASGSCDKVLLLAGDTTTKMINEKDRSHRMVFGDCGSATLIEKAEQAYDEKKALEMAEKIRANKFTLQDYLDQLGQVKNMGDLSQMASMIPGVNAKALEGAQMDDKAIAHIEAIITSMTPYERENPEVLNSSRKKRIAAGCGMQVVDINRLLKQYEAMQQMMKMVSGKGMKKMRKKMGGMGGFPGIPGF